MNTITEEQAKLIGSAIVDWLYNNGKIADSVYGRMTMDGDGEDGKAIAHEILRVIEE